MKVLTIIEPFAAHIKENRKKIETRSWKTNYRGELYIHAASKKIPKEWKNNHDYMKTITKLNYGKIICKCKLVDCIFMTEEFIENLKKDNYQEYLLGIYEVGRYAWVLDEVETIDEIHTKGHLRIWDYE